jgi:AraC-like DNA-binding protein
MKKNGHKEKYYLTEVDKIEHSIYCHHDLMGEVFIDTHSHKKGQFIYTEGGIVYIKTGTKTHFLPARHYMWIPPDVEHAIYPSKPEVIMRNLYFPVAKTDAAFFKNVGIYPVNELLWQLLCYTRKWEGDIFETDEERFPVVTAFKVLLAQISIDPLMLTLPRPKDPRLEKALVYLKDNLDKNIKLTEITAYLGMSERTLHRLFKSDVKMTFIYYYTLLRMFKALEYVLEKKHTIGEIALMVGYSSLPTFSTTFLKILGKRPSEYLHGNRIYVK